MSKLVLLDSGPLGMITNPKATLLALECQLWFDGLLVKGHTVAIPEITDYEVRRELMRAGKASSIRKLDLLKSTFRYLSITTPTMLKAAELWARSRQQGRPTADPKELDGDVILAAQALLVANDSNEVVVATTNVAHLSQFVDAREWQLIN